MLTDSRLPDRARPVTPTFGEKHRQPAKRTTRPRSLPKYPVHFWPIRIPKADGDRAVGRSAIDSSDEYGVLYLT